LQPPKGISLENADPENPPWTENMLGPPIIKYGKELPQSSFKIPTTINLDADILAWLKMQEVGYEIFINNSLRHLMEKNRSNM